MISQNNQRIAELSSENIGILNADLFPDSSGTLTDEQIQEIKEIADKDVVLFLQSDNEYVYTATHKIKTGDYSIFEFIQAVPGNTQGNILTLIEITVIYTDKIYQFVASEYEIKTTGDGTKFLSDDGSYKEIKDVYFIDAAENTDEGEQGVRNAIAANKLPVFNHLYEGKPAYDLSPVFCSFNSNGDLSSYSVIDKDTITTIELSSNGRTVIQNDIVQTIKVNINDYINSTLPEEQYDKLKVMSGTKVILIDDPDEGWYSIPAFVHGLTNIEVEYIYKGKYNKISIDNSRNVTKTSIDLNIDLSNYLSKDNTTTYTPTGNYNPATKYYVDDFMHCSGGLNNNTTDPITTTFGYKTGNHDDIANHGSLDCFIYAVGNISIPYYINTVTNEGYTYEVLMHDSDGNLLKIENTNFVIDAEAKTASITLVPKYIQRILTESEYQALGDSVNSDGILYFITED